MDLLLSYGDKMMIHFYNSLNTIEYITILAIGIALSIYGTIRYKGWRWLSGSSIVMGILLIINRLVYDSELSTLHKPLENITVIASVLFLLYILVGCGIVKYKQNKNNSNSRRK